MDATLLTGLPLFASVPADELGRLAATSRTFELSVGGVLFHEGEAADVFFVLLDGEIGIVKSLGTGDEKVFDVVQAGAVIGEMSLFSQDRRRTASARARTPAKLIEIAHADLEALLARYPGIALHIMRTLSLRLEGSQNLTIQDLRQKNAELTQAYEDLKAAQAQIIEKEKLEQELRIAREVQARLIPRQAPSAPGWLFDALWRPAREVSGDFYDFIPLSGERLGLVLGDATGKGMPAALAMATMRTMLRALADQHASPGAALARVNDLLIPDMSPSMFVTCLYGVLDLATGRMALANAGLSMPLIATSAGVREVRVRGMPLGLLEGAPYEESEVVLDVGDRLLMYSDGLVEAHRPDGEMLGFPRLRDFVATTGMQQPLVAQICSQFDHFVGPDWNPEDDVTLLSAARLPADARQPSSTAA